jgi:outer membrane protein
MRRTCVSRRKAAICAGASAALAVGLAVGGPAREALAADAVAPAAPTVAAAPAGRSMSLADCVALAVQESPDVKSRDADLAVAEADRAGVKGAFGPKLTASAAILGNTSATLSFAGSTLNIPSAWTGTVGATLTEPLSPLFVIYEQYKIQDMGVDVATIERVATRREIALRTVQAYYGLLAAIRLASVADDSVAQLEAQERQAKSQFTNGVIGKNDLLRASLALAGARQRAIQTRGQVQIQRGQLATVMGRPVDDVIEPVPVTGDPPPSEEPSVEVAEETALKRRVEVRELDQKIAQARRAKSIAKEKLLPTVNAVGSYMMLGGTLIKPPLNVFYGGLNASWDVWDWGTTTSGIDKADAQVDQAIAARKKLADTIQNEARQAFVNAATARDAFVVARAAVTQAEENYRIVGKKFEANAATSFDMVDAEALLTQARGQVETALYDALIAQAALKKATGAALAGAE